MKCPNRVQVSTCMFFFDSSWWHSLLKTDLMISLTYSTLPVKLIPAKWGDFVMLSPNVCPEDGIKFTTPRWKKQQQKKQNRDKHWQDVSFLMSKSTQNQAKMAWMLLTMPGKELVNK